VVEYAPSLVWNLDFADEAIDERNAPLGICPQGGSAQNGEMEHEWQREKKGEIIPWKASAWGSAFAEMKNLKELEIELETSEDKVGELKAIVEHAKGWKFPMRDGMVLRTDGLPTTTMEWRGNFCHWSDQCPYCGKYGECWKPTVQSQWCQEKERLLAEGKGPMLTVITVRYKLAKGEGLR
jgi:hypothetical protein